jgi:chromosome segregation ATPase
MKRLGDDNEAKSEEIRKITGQYDDVNVRWNDRIEYEKNSVRSQYESLLNTVKERNEELRLICSKTNESVLGTERHNRDLLRRINALERELEQITRQLDATKEENMREKQLLETKTKAAGIRLEMKCQAEIEDLKVNFEDEKRKMFGLVAEHFAHFFDARHSFDAQSFREVIEKASSEIERLKETDAAVRRILCLSNDESTENAVSKLLLSLYHQ